MATRPTGESGSLAEHTLHWLVFAILVAFTFARLTQLPYSGFDLAPDGSIIELYTLGTAGNELKVGDRLVSVGSLTWEAFESDFGARLFADAVPGSVAPIVVQRDGTRLSVDWTYPGPTPGQVLRYTLAGHWLGYVFWVAGLLTALHLRPRGEAWRVAIAFNYFNAVASMFGGDAAFYHLWYSAYLLRFAVWIGVPLYLHFHWYWPRPLSRLPPVGVLSAYALAALIGLAQCRYLLPANAHLAAIVFAILGSLVLLLAHMIVQVELRRQRLWFVTVLILAILPLLAFPFLSSRLGVGVSSILGAIGLPLIPLVYLTAVRRRQLGQLEVRLNRAVTVYTLLVLQGVLLLPLLAFAAVFLAAPAAVIIVGIAAGITSTVVTRLAYAPLHSFFERRVLGIPVPHADIVRGYVSRITASPSIPRLAALLRDDVLPSLLIRQFLFLRLDQDRPQVLLATGLTHSEIPTADEIQALSGQEGWHAHPVRALSSGRAWIRLIMPLRVEGELIGIWLLGRRDPDDQYLDREIDLIRSLADQTAIAFSHCLQTERLRELYQANVTRTEQERLQLALALHDSVLNQLAALLMKFDDPSVTPGVLKSFEEFSHRVREIVADLRPPMLTYGLLPALRELVETLGERSPEQIRFSMELPDGDVRYPEAVELHLFRIVQESCENALRHAGPSLITIRGQLDPDRAELEIADDGIGFDAPDDSAMGRLIAQKHFGLAGLIERANLIGGTVQMESSLGHGTRIRVVWKAKATGALPAIVH